MANIDEMRAGISKIRADIKGLQDSAAAEERELADDECTKIDAWLDQADKLTAEVQVAEGI